MVYNFNKEIPHLFASVFPFSRSLSLFLSLPLSPTSVRSAQHCAQASASSPHLSASVWAWQRTGGPGGEFGLLPLLWTSWILWLLGWLCGCARPCKPSESQQPPITGQYHLMRHIRFWIYSIWLYILTSCQRFPPHNLCYG